jgi:hypothetical protein
MTVRGATPSLVWAEEVFAGPTGLSLIAITFLLDGHANPISSVRSEERCL